jgi:hypothetical protein
MTTVQVSFRRLKSAGVQGAKVVGRDQLSKISADHNGHSIASKGAAGERSKAKGSEEKPVRRR